MEKLVLLVWIVLGVVAIDLAIALVKKRIHSGRGFKDFVNNPEYWDDMNQSLADVDATAKAAKAWNDATVAAFTKQFVLEVTSSEDAWDQARILRELGERSYPTVLGLLRDSSLYSRLVKPSTEDSEDILPEAPFNRACDLLGDSPSSESVDVLAPYLADPSADIRKDAALVIAKTGAASITPLMRLAFSDQDDYVNSYALMGLEFALVRSALPDSVKVALFPDVLDLLRAGRNEDYAASILYLLDSTRAVEYFLSQEVLTVDSPILYEILKVMADRKAAVPPDDLKTLIAALEVMELEYPKDYALGKALLLLGQQQREEDRDFIRKFTTHKYECVAKDAAAGLLCSLGLGDVNKMICETVERLGYASLTEHQRLHCAVLVCDGEIGNGGLAQYFMNSSGNQWPDALAGFEAMGFQERLAILEEALAKFEGGSPSTDQDIRQDQLADLYKRDDTVFDSLEDRYRESSEVVEVFASRFVLENPGSFR